MNSRYYYSFDDSLPARAVNACSRASDEYPLIVNYAGNVVTSVPLITDNVRGRDDYYLMYVVSGSLDVTLEDGAQKAVPGNIILLAPEG